jgi:predicted branched-subunit amino acid permease
MTTAASGQAQPSAELSPFAQGLRSSLPVATSFVFSFFALGAITRGAGLNAFQATAMTALMFAGPAQFAVMSLLVAGKPAAEALLAVLVINFRFFIMALNLLPTFRGVPLLRVLVGVPMLSASTFAVTQLGARDQNTGRAAHDYFLGVSIGSYPVAVAFTAIGNLSAHALPEAILKSAPAILPIYFAIMLTKDVARLSVLLCAGTALLSTPLAERFFPSGGSILSALLVAAGFAYFTGGKQEVRRAT